MKTSAGVSEGKEEGKHCELCPCKPTTPVQHRVLLREVYGTIKESGGFPCHHKHPTATALHQEAIGADGKFINTDCAGYKLWGLSLKERP
jgi:hypothetical protein